MSLLHRLVFVGGLVLATIPASGRLASAQGVFNMGTLTNTVAQGAVTQSERIRAGGGKKRAPRRPVAVNRALLRFTPDRAARKRNFAAFADNIARTDPAAGAEWRKVLAKGDVIAEVAPGFRQAGLRTNDLADAMSASLVNAWHGVRGSTDGTKAQFVAVSKQFAEVVTTTPRMRGLSNALKQETAESMILSALIVDANVKAGKKDPSQMPRIKAQIAQGARAAFGFDLTALKIGPNGFAKR